MKKTIALVAALALAACNGAESESEADGPPVLFERVGDHVAVITLNRPRVHNAINAEMAEVQTRITTGRRVNSAKDNPAIWAIAQNQRAEVRALDSVR